MSKHENIDILAVMDDVFAELRRFDGHGAGNLSVAADRLDQARDAVAELILRDRWVPFSEAWPPETAAIDDPNVKTRDAVLVTNNINGRDRMGRMSHMWILSPMRGERGEVIGFTNNGNKVHGLTHWRYAGDKP